MIKSRYITEVIENEDIKLKVVEDKIEKFNDDWEKNRDEYEELRYEKCDKCGLDLTYRFGGKIDSYSFDVKELYYQYIELYEDLTDCNECEWREYEFYRKWDCMEEINEVHLPPLEEEKYKILESIHNVRKWDDFLGD
tara:strand:- start:227 stop:640 length:414 start_codon:yes stop_codon:yes gene_type:complete